MQIPKCSLVSPVPPLFIFAHYLMKFFRLFLLYLNYFFNSSHATFVNCCGHFRVFSKSIDFVFVFAALSFSFYFFFSWAGEYNSKILCKYFVCIFHLIFNLLSSLFIVFLLPIFTSIAGLKNSWRIYGFVGARVFFFFFEGWVCVCGRGSLSTAAILMNSIDWTEPRVLFYTL